jgi:hypothetical protein
LPKQDIDPAAARGHDCSLIWLDLEKSLLPEAMNVEGER